MITNAARAIWLSSYFSFFLSTYFQGTITIDANMQHKTNNDPDLQKEEIPGFVQNSIVNLHVP